MEALLAESTVFKFYLDYVCVVCVHVSVCMRVCVVCVCCESCCHGSSRLAGAVPMKNVSSLQQWSVVLIDWNLYKFLS